MIPGLVLSTFTGAGLMDRGFIDAGYCVVSAGEPMFGQPKIEGFHPPAGAFEGVIGGPPCQEFAQNLNLAGDIPRQVNLIPEFERVVLAAQPRWFLMENVATRAPVPDVEGYHIVDRKIYAWELGNPQRRYRRFSFGSKPPVQFLWPHGEKPPRIDPARYGTTRAVMPTLTASNTTQRRTGEAKVERINGKTAYTLDDYRYGFGLPCDWDAPALLKEYKFRVLGNGVPLQVSRALAEAVRYATGRGREP